ncbi:MAG: WbuC family cupin fold metalloprotein [Desulfuromonadales bacterium]|nr:WbuC family cupin fold metalloprotein [Desulfuromonadales bacterium]
MRIITSSDLDALSHTARTLPRRRLNLNMHADYADPCQRLFNAVEPGSYLRPHRHTDPPKPECFVAIRGRFHLLIFDDAGKIIERIDLSPAGGAVAAEVPPGTWHAIVALEPGSLFFETKPGPYTPLTDKDFAPWAPAEGSEEAGEYLEMVMRVSTCYLPGFYA